MTTGCKRRVILPCSMRDGADESAELLGAVVQDYPFRRLPDMSRYWMRKRVKPEITGQREFSHVAVKGRQVGPLLLGQEWRRSSAAIIKC